LHSGTVRTRTTTVDHKSDSVSISHSIKLMYVCRFLVQPKKDTVDNNKTGIQQNKKRDHQRLLVDLVVRCLAYYLIYIPSPTNGKHVLSR